MSDPVSSIVETPQLLVACESCGPSNAPPVLLLHGWSDDVRTWDGVAGPLAEEGFRVIVPFLRGFGPTRFRDASTARTGQPSALACDARQLLDALELPRVTVVGHDWGNVPADPMFADLEARMNEHPPISIPTV
jgi:pimeloyl-ACP methyl ester carboxylesterase